MRMYVFHAVFTNMLNTDNLCYEHIIDLKHYNDEDSSLRFGLFFLFLVTKWHF